MNTNQSSSGPLNLTSMRANATTPKYINTEYLMEISSGSQEFVAVFLKTFREEAKRSLLNLQMHLVNNDFLFLERTAHAMKPTGAYIGSHALTLLVSFLEKAAHNLDRKEATRLVPQIQSMTENILKEIDEYLK